MQGREKWNRPQTQYSSAFQLDCKPVQNSANRHSRTVNPLAYAFDGSNPSLPTPLSARGWVTASRHGRLKRLVHVVQSHRTLAATSTFGVSGRNRGVPDRSRQGVIKSEAKQRRRTAAWWNATSGRVSGRSVCFPAGRRAFSPAAACAERPLHRGNAPGGRAPPHVLRCAAGLTFHHTRRARHEQIALAKQRSWPL